MILRLLMLGCALIPPAIPAANAGDVRVRLKGSGHALGPTPVLAKTDRLAPGEYLLTPGGEGGGSPIPGSVIEDNNRRYLAFVLPGLGADEERTYAVAAAEAQGEKAGVAIAERGKDLEITLGGQPWTRLHNEEGAKPFLHPMLGPGGRPFTRAFPMEDKPGEEHDHPHQRSFWFTHGNVNGVDFWSESGKNGTIREAKRLTVRGSAALGVIRTANDWLKPDGAKVCEDERVLRFWGAGPARIVDFEVTVKATDGPVTFGDTKEGAFGIRVATSMDVDRKKGGRIVNAEGLVDKDAWGQASPWVDYTGPVEGEEGGTAILNHPKSFRYPTTWHVRTYGLFAANPFGWRDFGREESGNHTIPEGEAMNLRYRVIFHDGDTAQADIASAFAGYAHPPKVTVQAD